MTKASRNKRIYYRVYKKIVLNNNHVELHEDHPFNEFKQALLKANPGSKSSITVKGEIKFA